MKTIILSFLLIFKSGVNFQSLLLLEKKTRIIQKIFDLALALIVWLISSVRIFLIVNRE